MSKKVTITTIKAEDIAFNAFLADQDKVGDQVQATITLDDQTLSAMGDNEELAIEALRQKVSDYYNAKKHKANLEINKAIGLAFFE